MTNRKSIGEWVAVTVGDGFLATAIRYLVLIPLLAPRGLDGISLLYKHLMAGWSALVLAYVVVCLVYRLRLGVKDLSPLIAPVVYFCIAVLVTVFSAKGVSRGLQEMLLYPVVFVFLATLSDERRKAYEKSAAVLLSALFAVQLLFLLGGHEISFHVTFLGHIQVISQYGLLALYLSFVLFFGSESDKILSLALFVVTAACMVAVDADSSHFALIIFLLLVVLLKAIPSLLRIDFSWVTIAGVAFSLIVVLFTVCRCGPLAAMGVQLDFSGRLYVWQSALDIFLESPLFGYGIGNPVIVTFWSSGMDYAHNQVMQCLVDGGLALFAAMLWMLLSVSRCINLIENDCSKCASAAALCALLFVMVFDSVTPYVYSYVLLAFICCEGMALRSGELDGNCRDRASGKTKA